MSTSSKVYLFMRHATFVAMHKNVWVLTLAQSFMMSINTLNVFVGGIIGGQMAPMEELATLPVACTIVGTALSTVPLALIMKQLGRKRTFLHVAIFMVIVSLLTAYAITIQNFYFFSLCTLLLGVGSATTMQFRFASMESVVSEQIPKAASYVLIGGIVAAFLGPEVAVLGKSLLPVEFAGSFLLLGVLCAIAFLILLQFENTIPVVSEFEETARPLKQIALQKAFWVAILGGAIGYAVMSFIMTATPVSMHVMDGHALSDTKWVIQSHIVAMFLPSLITGSLIRRFGTAPIMMVGLVAYLICIRFAFAGHFVHHYWGALVLLGIGWNFLFIGGTSLLPNTYAPSERFKVQAFNDFFLFTSQAIAALSAGWVVFEFGWEVLVLIALPFIGIQFIAIWWWKHDSK